MSELVVLNASELATPISRDGKPALGDELGKLHTIQDAGLVVEDGKIVMVGTSGEIRSSFDFKEHIDARGKTLVPGFVDPHVHLIWGGSRE
ncbi:MAG: amidohydrolase family protein, partial [Candidatus Thermoplasmatota archaeon]|nr:amidohydrolase family protein [Candidatus Thermoplasmatota archaeon]